MSSDISRQPVVASTTTAPPGVNLSGYFNSIFGVKSTPVVSIPPTSSTDTSAYYNTPSSPYSDDWTFGIFRKNSVTEGLPHNSSWSGFSLFHSGKSDDLAVSNDLPDSGIMSVSSGQLSMKPLNDTDFGKPQTASTISHIQSTVIYSSPTTIVSPNEFHDKGKQILGNDSAMKVIESSVDPVSSSRSPVGRRRKGLFDYDRLPVNKKELNMIAPTST